MILYPAIDLKDGQCVRLLRGAMDAATVFNDDPGAQARAFVDAGAPWVHVVDLNGAFAGRPVNADAVEAILAAIGDRAQVQLGGGIRSVEGARAWIERGVSRIVLGTVAVKDPQVVRDCCTAFPGQVAVGVDARDGRVAVEGWAEATEIEALDLVRRFEDAGVAAVVYTDIDRDGALGGVNVEATAELAKAVSIPVIASGGVKDLGDLKALIAAGGIAGAISGRALYDGRLDLREALALTRAEASAGC
ncbi:MAG: 1-(5-phosphoribosyl)-5-[(5-phosphoribosylamino)methylideneamino]imidazole-4-carboxamide isomerase [Marivibrio sp.]|uniref:1-(5-phosphoribosyl)-5-[(5- phosphoribosylamino)methylideneamino]imidazole-4- carboxamide isomerase n=1 Tax=Marivibrio sp. TaxID=2039719 RepID=UPI0032F051B4